MVIRWCMYHNNNCKLKDRVLSDAEKEHLYGLLATEKEVYRMRALIP